jgi:hypothetical protein
MSGFREAEGALLQHIDTRIEAGFSNFVFVDRFFYSSPVVRRIFSIARKLGFQSLQMEEVRESDSGLFALENAALAKRFPNFTHSKVLRVSFFRTPPEKSPVSCLGYLIFKVDFFADRATPDFHVYEAVMHPSRSARGNNFIHCAKDFEIRTSLGTFTVTGALYAQQNDKTFVCAHAALRTVVSAASHRDIDYPTMNQWIGVDHQSRQLGSGASTHESGLDRSEMERILRQAGLELATVVHEPGRLEFPGEFQRELYGVIESGMPALLGFELDAAPDLASPGRHIIAVLGHTLNEDTWVADAARAYFDGGLQYYSSENWLSTYVVHDDNFGPYLCLPRHFLRKKNFRLQIGVLRFAVELTAIEAEAIGLNFCNVLAQAFAREQPGWLGRFAAFAESNLLVLRTLLLTRDEYLGHLRDSLAWNSDHHHSVAVARIAETIPEQFWMVEASAPELFSASRRKFGELLVRSDLSPEDANETDLWLSARLPGSLLVRAGQGFHAIESGIGTHTPLFEFST